MGLTIPTLNALCAERRAQDAQWGGREHDATHTIEEWQQYLHDHTARLTNDPDPKQRLIKIAALALAAAEVQPTQYAACWGEHTVIERTHDYAIDKLIEDVLSEHAEGWRTPDELVAGDDGRNLEHLPQQYEVTLHVAEPHRWGDVRDDYPWRDMDDTPDYDDDEAIVYSAGKQLRKETITMRYNKRREEWEADR